MATATPAQAAAASGYPAGYPRAGYPGYPPFTFRRCVG